MNKAPAFDEIINFAEYNIERYFDILSYEFS